jgi:signal transduction histidine kinase
LVSVLLGLAFVPLFWTATTFSRLSLERTERTSALRLGQAVGRAIADGNLDPVLMPPVVGLRFHRSDGTQLSLGHQSDSAKILWSSSRGHEGVVHVGVTVHPPGSDQKSFVGLLALYMGLLGSGLLLAIYMALTFLIVRPLDELGRAAHRVSQGLRPILLPQLPARELSSLGKSLSVMTERLLAEEQALKARIIEVHETNERLKQAQERLLRSERLASVGRLAAGLAHELGNPISAMMGLEELLLQGGLTPTEERDFLRRIQGETERVHRILRDLLDFARPTTKTNSKEEEEPGSVLAAIDDVLALTRPQKAFRHLRVTTKVPEDLPWVLLPRPKLVQVLLNLLLNAADALPSDGTVCIFAQLSSDHELTLAVEDDGPGVPITIRQSLFEPFVTTKDVGKGTGLGLAVCRGLVEHVGGTIALDESHLNGARFIITLPTVQRNLE